ncbi:hypothetical protein BA726_18455 [Klebsiella pneumoniae]|nr:hypothetical protein BA726_18455 [Klebsiella pneumoniae]
MVSMVYAYRLKITGKQREMMHYRTILLKAGLIGLKILSIQNQCSRFNLYLNFTFSYQMMI